MECGKGKLKIVWLCGFTNQQVQELLKPHRKVNQIAPWISGLLKIFENNNEVELHVISPHLYISRYKRFELNGITYHFINQGIPFLGIKWPTFFPADLWMDYYYIKKQVGAIIKEINPDLIHLHGAENTYHSAAIMQFEHKLPVFITVQGIINNSSSKSPRAIRRKIREKQIYNTFKHFGIRTKTMGEDVKRFNPSAKLHWHSYKINEIVPVNTDKKFDIVFFARISKEKGIEDLLKALAILKINKKNISLCVIGGGNREPYKLMADKLQLTENIHWAGFLPTQEDVHKMASQARISVLPTYHDIISGTIVESLFLKLPVVAYNVGSINEVNEKEEIISLVEKLDVEGLAKSIEELLENPELRDERAEKGYNRAVEMFLHSDEEIRESLLNIYNHVIDEFYRKTKN